MKVRDFKAELKGLQPAADELTRKLSRVDVIVQDKQLVEDDETIMEAGIRPGVSVQVLFSSISPVECISQSTSGYDRDSLLVVQIPSSTMLIQNQAPFG